MTRILAFAGSTRVDSFNKRLVRVAAEGARRAGAEVTLLDLRDHPMPLFDEDLEASEGMPETARRFKQALASHDGWLLAAPEYNSSISAVLKNAIDWATRATEPGEPPLLAFSGKVAALMAASPGALGGLRGLGPVRSILSSIGVIVLPGQVAVPRAHEAFDSQGGLRDAALSARVEALGTTLARTADALRALR